MDNNTLLGLGLLALLLLINIIITGVTLSKLNKSKDGFVNLSNSNLDQQKAKLYKDLLDITEKIGLTLNLKMGEEVTIRTLLSIRVLGPKEIGKKIEIHKKRLEILEGQLQEETKKEKLIRDQLIKLNRL
jgi:hypothetical protein